jgi:RHH-type transcriptional regulator, rel operon repressor / antitoxin RelB
VLKSMSIRIDEDVKLRWEKLAQSHGLNPSRLMREAIIEKLEELEDFYVVRARTSEPFEPVPSADVWKRAGLED